MERQTLFWLAAGGVLLLVILIILFNNKSTSNSSMSEVSTRWSRCTQDMRNTKTNIRGFCASNAFLSNFYLHPVIRAGVEYTSTESAYQAAKYDDQPDIQKLFIGVSPDESKKLVSIYPNDAAAFSKRRVAVMRELLVTKFTDPDLRSRLLATGTKLLEEYNWWGDTYWGITKTGGSNQLGLLLMELRQQINESQ